MQLMVSEHWELEKFDILILFQEVTI
jgi:hypothetical protein